MNTYIIEFLHNHNTMKCAIRASNEKSAELIAIKELRKRGIICKAVHCIGGDNAKADHALNRKTGDIS